MFKDNYSPLYFNLKCIQYVTIRISNRFQRRIQNSAKHVWCLVPVKKMNTQKESSIFAQQSSLIDVWQGSKYVSGLNFTSRTKTLLNETVEYAELTKFQNYNGKISQAQLINTFSFPGSPLNTKKTPFF